MPGRPSRRWSCSSTFVFVLALTQCTALMADQPTWEGLARGLLVLGVMWWSWVGYAWLTSVIDPEEGAVRLVIFAAMAAMLVASLCVPQAFGDAALVFACAYAFVRVAHIALFMLGSYDDANLRRSVIGLGISTAVGVALLLGASFADGLSQGALWLLALGLDMAGPAFFGVEGWRLSAHHFADRHGLIIIIALGESIVAIGVGVSGAIDLGVVTAAVLGTVIAARRGGCTSTSWRSSPRSGCRMPRWAASRTRWPATPSPSCTFRWSRASCSSRSG